MQYSSESLALHIVMCKAKLNAVLQCKLALHIVMCKAKLNAVLQCTDKFKRACI